MTTTRFESLGVYMPDNAVTSQDMISRMKMPLGINLEKITGIKSRRICSADDYSYDMALAAAKECLKRSKYSAIDLDVIINTSITTLKDGNSIEDPPMSLFVKRAIGSRMAMTFDISNACAGMLTGAFVLNNMIASGMVNNGMVVSGERISVIAETALEEIANKIDPQFSSLTVGDSGAAFILDRTDNEEGIDIIDIFTSAEFARLCIGKPSDRTNRFAMYTEPKIIHDESMKRTPLILEYLFGKRGRRFDPSEYDYIITHQTSVKAIKSMVESVGRYFPDNPMPPELYSVVDYGNTSTTTHFVALHEAMKRGIIGQSSKILFLSNASGITIGCMSATLRNLRA